MKPPKPTMDAMRDPQLRQLILNRALYYLIEKTGDRKVVIPMDFMDEELFSENGISVIVDARDKTVTLRLCSLDAAIAMTESIKQPKH